MPEDKWKDGGDKAANEQLHHSLHEHYMRFMEGKSGIHIDGQFNLPLIKLFVCGKYL